ncbi:hypothetical protein CU098_007975, partial [Rhizopus stolonifer]
IQLFSQDLKLIHWKHPDHISQELKNSIFRSSEGLKRYCLLYHHHHRYLLFHLSTPSNLRLWLDQSARVSTKEFWLTCQNATSVPERLQAISSAFWVDFWSWSLLPVARNMLYPIPCLQATHKTVSSLFLIRSPRLFVQFAPLILKMNNISFSIVCQRSFSGTITFSNFFLQNRLLTKKHLTVLDIVITALSQVWKAHWRFVIDN